MTDKFSWAAYKARSAKGSATDPTLYALAESLEAIAQGLDEQSKVHDQALRLLLDKLS